MKILDSETIFHMEGISQTTRDRMNNASVQKVENSFRLNSLYQFVDKNFLILHNSISTFTDLNNFLRIHLNQTKFIAFEMRDNISLFIFNYLSAVKSLVDHTRRLYEDEYQSIMPEYEIRKNALINEPLIKFVHNLRDYFTHYKPLELNTNQIMSPDGIKIELHLISKTLLEWDGWKRASKSFIESQGASINVAVVLTNYKIRIEHFHHWFQGEQKRILADDWSVFEDFNRREKEESAEKCLEIIEELASIEEAFTFRHYESLLASATSPNFWAFITTNSNSAQNRLEATIQSLIALGCDEGRVRGAYVTIEKKLQFAQDVTNQNNSDSDADERRD